MYLTWLLDAVIMLNYPPVTTLPLINSDLGDFRISRDKLPPSE